MMRTGLPYDFAKMEEIREEGAVVDMADLRFPTADQVRTAMIFLRNTGFRNVEHDFSRCSKELLARYLEEYLTTDIEIDIPELSALALDAMRYMLGMSEDCTIEPEGRLRDTLCEVMRVYVSAPLYFIHRLQDGRLEMDAETEKAEHVGANLQYLFTGDIDSIADAARAQGMEPAFYADIFTMENNGLFNAIMDSSMAFPAMLFAMTETEPGAWESIVHSIERVAC